MEWMIVVLCLVIIAGGAVGVLQGGRKTDENAPKSAFKKDRPCCRKSNKTVQEQREREKEAHYMRNFWNYDGSEQQEWDEEG